LAAVIALVGAAIGATVCGSKTTTMPTASTNPPPATPRPTYTVSGVVTDSTNGKPLTTATVSVANTGHQASTDGNGYYSIPGLAGAIGLHAVAAGYNGTDKNLSLQGDTRADFVLARLVVVNPQCDASLWNHLYDPTRLKVNRTCQTVTGVIATQHSSDDGDIDMQLTVDAPFANLLNKGNIANLNGNLQIEAICQDRVHDDNPAAGVSCAGFKGSVPIVPVGTHIQVTGSYVLDTNHGWMEIHPISVLTIQ
jgi:carboxypeptidase family protein